MDDYQRTLMALVRADGDFSPAEQQEVDRLLREREGGAAVVAFSEMSAGERQRTFEEFAFVAACDGELHEGEVAVLRQLALELELDEQWISETLGQAGLLAQKILEAMSEEHADPGAAEKPGAESRAARLWAFLKESGAEFAEQGAAAGGGAAGTVIGGKIAYAGLSGTLLKGAVLVGLAAPPAAVVIAPMVGAAAAVVAVRKLSRIGQAAETP